MIYKLIINNQWCSRNLPSFPDSSSLQKLPSQSQVFTEIIKVINHQPLLILPPEDMPDHYSPQHLKTKLWTSSWKILLIWVKSSLSNHSSENSLRTLQLKEINKEKLLHHLPHNNITKSLTTSLKLSSNLEGTSLINCRLSDL